MDRELDQTTNVFGRDDNSQVQMKNTSRQQRPVFVPRGDANANEILARETAMGDTLWVDGGPISSLVSQSDSQERVFFWGDTECDEADLEELELLECQELEALLEKDGRNQNQNVKGSRTTKAMFYGRQPKPAHPATTTHVSNKTSCSSNSGSSHVRAYQQNNNNQWRVGGSVEELECAADEHYASESLKKARSNSEGNVFASSSLSAVPNLSSSLASALDGSGAGNSQLSQYVYPTSAHGRGHQYRPARGPEPAMDQNHNTMLPHGQGPGKPNSHIQGYPIASHVNSNRKFPPSRLVPPKQRLEELYTKPVLRHDMNGRQVSDTSHERVPPCRRQLVRPYVSEATPEHSSWVCDSNPQTPGNSSSDLRHASHNQHPMYRVMSQANGSSQHAMHSGSGSLKGKSHQAGPSSLERKAPVTPRLCRSPSMTDGSSSPRDTGSPRKHPPISPPKATLRGGYTSTHLGYNVTTNTTSNSVATSSHLRAPVRTSLGTSIPKTPLQERLPPHEKSSPPKCPLKPKSVRPKIITCVRKGPAVKPQAQTEGPSHHSSSYPARAERENLESPVLSASNLLFDKYRQEMQKSHHFNTTATGSLGKAPSHTVPQKQPNRGDNFYGSLNSKYMTGGVNKHPTQFSSLGSGHGSGTDGVPQRTLRPQLGVAGAVRGPTSGAPKQRTYPPSSQHQPVQAVSPAPQLQQSALGLQTDVKKSSAGLTTKSLLPKPSLSSLRAPGFSRLPPSRLTAFGFVRSSSVSSVSSNQSSDSIRSDPCRPPLRPSSVSDEPPFHRIISPSSGEVPRGPSLQPPATPALKRRSLLPPPAAASKKELQKNPEIARPALPSPKRLAVVSPKPQSPVPSKQRPVAAVQSVALTTSPDKNAPETTAPPQKEEKEQEVPLEQEVQQLQERCQKQARELERMRVELKRTTLGLEAFAICTQHLCLQSQTASEREKELSLELERIKDDMAQNKIQLEQIQQEKAGLVECFHQEVKDLQGKQEEELAALEAELRSRHSAELEHLRAEHQSEVEELRTQQQEQMDELSLHHESAMDELKTMQDLTMATLQEEHTRTMRDLRKAHEQHKSKLEEDFEHFRLSLQDQVDTLTFQNQTLRDKAKRFEEALRKSADEQIVDALAPYQHIEEDLKSLKGVLEMKNQQIHNQEKKISELEKMAHKNIVLEERVQVLQQQNEDMKARIDQNLAISRQLSEENATLHVSVEKESNEKKRLSRNNEELLWRLHMSGELSPRMSPCASPSHHSGSGSGGTSSPFYPMSVEIPPYHYSPGPATPTHGTPTHHRVLPLSGPGSPAPRSSPARALTCASSQ